MGAMAGHRVQLGIPGCSSSVQTWKKNPGKLSAIYQVLLVCANSYYEEATFSRDVRVRARLASTTVSSRPIKTQVTEKRSQRGEVDSVRLPWEKNKHGGSVFVLVYL